MSVNPAARRPWAALLLFLAACGLAAAPVPSRAQDVSYFRIGTGGTGETHFPVGGLLANAISNPPGSRSCEDGGSCGVPGLVAVAQSTHGSVENVLGVNAGRLEGALVQADVAYWAAQGSRLFEEQGVLENLRAVAMLYTDSVHLVARRDAGIDSVADLKGRRVSLGARGSGTLFDARGILAAYDLEIADLDVSYLSAGAAADALAAGELDAFFVIDAEPVPSVAELAADVPIELVPLSGGEAEQLRGMHPFFIMGAIAGGTYEGVPEDTPTLSVPVVFVVRADLDADLVKGVTRALWHPSTQNLLREGHPRGRPLDLQAGAEHMGLPLHEGAAAYYREAGLLQAGE